MFKLFDVSYEELKEGRSSELYQLRKTTFRDRLQWDVKCVSDMEVDEYDNSATRYILGIYKEQLISSVRFIGLDKPNMITHTFQHCFDDIELPLHMVESSRFFVDKNRGRQLLGERYPVSNALFLSMINYAISHKLEGIYTIVSRAMLAILKRSGWRIEVIKEAFLKPKEPIYLLLLPVDKDSQSFMAEKVATPLGISSHSLISWPLSLPVTCTTV